MKRADSIELTGLAAIWGASFLFMRMGAAEFGPVALAAVRVWGATLFLLPLLALRGQAGALRAHWRPIFVVGITNSALPFLCFSYAALSITAGLSSIFNAATPLFGALIAWAWLRDKLTPARMAGLAIGFLGVLWLAWDKASFKPGASSGWAVLACLAATLLYGFSGSFTKRFLTGVPPLAVATGSQLSSALLLAVPALVWWPAALPSLTAWSAAALLAVGCTGIAYILFFRLIAHIGPANALSVTFLIPVFAVLWGWLFLHESLTPQMLLGCAVILLGTSLTTGVLKPPAWFARHSA
ncbi:DMT family transporter [Rhizobacter sp. OV335]|uniref:DMT family transporter n=1 Tax=Rhizobacter sp. OV335 TaxID=1500264 RepID=UPI00091E39D9|nr:DMT family transporter [Rhizobacter sp. OV335]SHM90830.1 EamA domain-containing membrane protein RarD [Rhizobacter sp. OV335]